MSSEDSWIGTSIEDRYVLSDRIARGGMSTVYRARDERLHRDVAIKVLFPHMAEDRKVVQRFEQEARNSALLSHPNVVQVMDQGQTRETAYMVMEYVPGATLRTLLKRGAMTPRLALAYGQAILAGLGAAHRAGLVHRDIKPENVLVSPEGRIKLADFGLARAATHHSGTSTLMGTVAYISPELLSGEGADERADIYAVGILLYEMLTGAQPFTGDTPVRVAYQHVNSTVPAPSAAVSGLAAPLDELVGSATMQDPGQRPKNADELLDLLNHCREQLSDEQLDFDGALTFAHGDHQPASNATQVMPAAAADADVPAQASNVEEPVADDAAATVAMSPGEDFPTAEEETDDEWATQVQPRPADEAATVVTPRQAARDDQETLHVPQWLNEHSQDADRWSTLAVADRQTVAEVPLPPRLSIDDETRAQPSVAATGTRPRPDAGRKERQRPVAQLTTPTPARAGVTVAILMIATAVAMFLAYQIGVSSWLIPSIGG